MLEGQYEFLVEGRTLRPGAGSLLYIPKGNLHAHKNISEGVGNVLVNQTPGCLYEGFFKEVGTSVGGDGGPLSLEDHPDVAGIGAIAAEYGIEIPSPIPEEVRPGNTAKGGRR